MNPWKVWNVEYLDYTHIAHVLSGNLYHGLSWTPAKEGRALPPLYTFQLNLLPKVTEYIADELKRDHRKFSREMETKLPLEEPSTVLRPRPHAERQADFKAE